MAEEKIFLDEKGVKVTNARFVTFAKTHALAGITSVSSYVIPPKRKGPIVVAILGVILFFVKWYLGIVFVALGVAWWISQKRIYQVVLSSASGSEDALSDPDSEFINRVVNALNEAIIHRG